MLLRFNFSTRDWLWFCVVVALSLGWGSHFRYSWWLEDNIVNHPTTIYVSDEQITEQLNDTQEQLMELKVKYAAVEFAATTIMSADQQKEFAKLVGNNLSDGR